MSDQSRLADIEAIKNFKATYGIVVDDLITNYTPEKLDRFAALFTEDLASNFGKPTGQLHGRQAILDFIGGTVRSARSWMWHSFHSPLIEVDGDTATGDWTIYCLALTRGASKPDVVLGRYQDKYVRTPQGWRQSSLTFVNETPENL